MKASRRARIEAFSHCHVIFLKSLCRVLFYWRSVNNGMRERVDKYTQQATDQQMSSKNRLTFIRSDIVSGAKVNPVSSSLSPDATDGPQRNDAIVKAVPYSHYTSPSTTSLASVALLDVSTVPDDPGSVQQDTPQSRLTPRPTPPACAGG